MSRIEKMKKILYIKNNEIICLKQDRVAGKKVYGKN